jgi:hypothetical protein
MKQMKILRQDSSLMVIGVSNWSWILWLLGLLAFPLYFYSFYFWGTSVLLCDAKNIKGGRAYCTFQQHSLLPSKRFYRSFLRAELTKTKFDRQKDSEDGWSCRVLLKIRKKWQPTLQRTVGCNEAFTRDYRVFVRKWNSGKTFQHTFQAITGLWTHIFVVGLGLLALLVAFFTSQRSTLRIDLNKGLLNFSRTSLFLFDSHLRTLHLDEIVGVSVALEYDGNGDAIHNLCFHLHTDELFTPSRTELGDGKREQLRTLTGKVAAFLDVPDLTPEDTDLSSE